MSPGNYPTLKQLQYFIALCDKQHFGKAAADCFVSQSAFSNAIQELETQLGVQLADRTRRQVTITAAGHEIAAQARRCIHEVEALVDLAANSGSPLHGVLRLGVIPTIAPFILPTLLPKLRRKYPDLQLYLTEDQTDRIHDKLMKGEVDLLLLALPYDLRGTDTQTLFKDHFLLAARQGSAKVDPDNYRFSKVPQNSILLLEDGHCLRDHALAACKLRNSEKVSPFAASSLLTLVEMIDADLGFSFLPEIAAGSSLFRSTKVRLHPTNESSYRQIGLAWRRGSRRAKEFQLLGDFIRQQCQPEK